MSYSEECLKKLYVQFRYLGALTLTLQPGQQREEPADCRQIKIMSPPEIRLLADRTEIVCAPGISLWGAGSIILLFQVGLHIQWTVGFLSVSGKKVTELHQVFASVPMFLKIHGQNLLLMRVVGVKSPAQWVQWAKLAATGVKAVYYSDLILKALNTLQEVEQALAWIQSTLMQGFCPENIQRFTDGLNKIETEANDQLRKAINRTYHGQDWDIARSMKYEGHGAGRSVGSRLA